MLPYQPYSHLKVVKDNVKVMVLCPISQKGSYKTDPLHCHLWDLNLHRVDSIWLHARLANHCYAPLLTQCEVWGVEVDALYVVDDWVGVICHCRADQSL